MVSKFSDSAMFSFLNGFNRDLRMSLLIQLRNLWTQTSTAIEGNTLTRGETAFVLEEEVTISGKPFKDHEEVVGYARAMDLICDCLQEEREFNKEDLLALHKAVQTEVVVDVYKPVGSWKKEPNSTVGVIYNKQVIFEYGRPSDIPWLMATVWLGRYLFLIDRRGDGNKHSCLQR